MGSSILGSTARELEAAYTLLTDPDRTSVVPRSPGTARPDAQGDPDATTDWGSIGGESTCGRYRVVRPHASGGIGMVSVAIDTELHREVAFKELQPEQADDPSSRNRFVLEAEVTGRLEHPGVVPVYGLGTLPGGRPYYAMRFVRGETLKEAIGRFHETNGQQGRLRGRRAIALRQLLARFLHVCDAVGYAHSRGVIHRDIKPANILMGPYGETLLVDWGLAKVVGRDDEPASEAVESTLRLSSSTGSSETRTGSAVGTPAYMSPEQAAGRLDVLGPASDVYSLGGTLYCLLTGRPPVEDRDLYAVIRRAQAGDFPTPRSIDRGIPAALEAVVLRAMAYRPEDRYPTAQALAGDIESWLADEPVSAYREPPAARVARWARRNRPVVAAAGVLLVTATAALGVNDRLVRAEKDRTEEQRRLAVDSFRKADEQRRLAQRLSASLTLDRGLALCERGEVNAGLLWLVRALETTPDGDVLAGAEAAEPRRLASPAHVARRHPPPSARDGPGRILPAGWASIVTVSRDSGQTRLDVIAWDDRSLRRHRVPSSRSMTLSRGTRCGRPATLPATGWILRAREYWRALMRRTPPSGTLRPAGRSGRRSRSRVEPSARHSHPTVGGWCSAGPMARRGFAMPGPVRPWARLHRTPTGCRTWPSARTGAQLSPAAATARRESGRPRAASRSGLR